MASNDINNSNFTIPDNVLTHLRAILAKYGNNTQAGGYKRLKGLVMNPTIGNQQMKRIKNYFDTYSGNGTDIEFILNGGETMRDWVYGELESERDKIHTEKELRSNAGEKNQFRKAHTKTKRISNDYLIDKLTAESALKEEVDKINKLIKLIK